MASKPHLEIYNVMHAAREERSSFDPFPRLPPELRQMVWRHSLQRERIIHVRLQTLATTVDGRMPADISPTHGNARHIAVVMGSQLYSKCLRINRESRAAALRFYRVHLPCWLSREDILTSHISKQRIFYFNPEFDFLYIKQRWSVQEVLVEFFYRLKTIHDPLRIGLRNLAIEDLSRGDHVALPNLIPAERAAFVDTIVQLREVFFVYRFRPMLRTPLAQSSAGRCLFLNRSMPILTTTTWFVRVPADPRDISADLARMFVERSVLCMRVRRWRELLARLGAFAAEPRQEQQQYENRQRTKYQLVICFEPRNAMEVGDARTAHDLLEHEDDAYRSWLSAESAEHRHGSTRWVQRPVNKYCRLQGDRGPSQHGWPRTRPPPLVPDDPERAVQPAFGFWTFPLDVLGPLEENSGLPLLDGMQQEPLDWSAHWPELALASLP